MPTDAELLRRYVATHAEDAFAELVRRHVNLVYFAALRQLGGDTHTAEEVAQSVFTDLARKAHSLSQREVLASWLYTSTRFAAAKARRAQARRHKHETEAEIMQAMHRETNPAADWETLRPLIDDVVHELDERDRGIVLLRFFEGRPFAEIGAACGLSEDAARMRVERALEKMRAALAKRGLVSTSAALGVALATQTGAAAPAALAATVTSVALIGAKTTMMGAGALLGTGIFMSKTLVIVSAVALTAIGSAVYQYAAAQRAQTAAREISRDRETLRGELRVARQQIAAVEQAAAAAKEIKAAPASGSNSPKAAIKPVDDAQDLRDAREKIRAAEARAAALRAELSQALDAPDVLRQAIAKEEPQFRAFYRRAGLSAAQLEQFRTLIGQHLRRQLELQSKALSRDPAATQAMEDQLAAEFIVDARALFGEETARLLQRHQETQPLRTLAEHLASNLFYTDTPLSVGQAEQLVDLLARDFSNGTAPINVAKLNADAVAQQAQSVLSAPQVTELRSVLADARRFRPASARPATSGRAGAVAK